MELAIAEVGPASSTLVSWLWFVSFVLAAATLAAVWWKFPNAKNMILGKDGRLSTSKFQAALWTFAVLFALFSLFYGFVIVQLFGGLLGFGWAESLEQPLGQGFDDFLGHDLDETYLLLLGFPFAAAITSKGIVAEKVASGTIVKAEKDPAEGGSSLAELVSDDDGNSDLGDFQYLLFNLLAIGYFLLQFLSDPGSGLPSMPDTLVGLTGVAAATFVAKKGIYRDPPVLLGVLPPSARPGEQFTVYGKQLKAPAEAGGPGAAPPGIGAMVVVNGQTAAVVGAPTATEITATVPEMAPGPVHVKVLRPPGASSEELPFTILPS
jgi:hypothetical protein